MSGYILVTLSSGSPVPLPLHTTHEGQPVTVEGGEPPLVHLAGTVTFKEDNDRRFICPANWLGLDWITEAEYMEKQS